MIRALCVGSVVLSLTGVAQAGEQPPSWLHEERLTHFNARTGKVLDCRS
jgi:hypothetical protein